jgi:hypothetical protein
VRAALRPLHFPLQSAGGSRKDIDACLAFDTAVFEEHAGAAPIREMFDAFKEVYPTEGEG